MRCRLRQRVAAWPGVRWTIALLLAVAVLGAIALLAEPAGRRVATREVRSRLERLSLRLERPVEIGSVEFGFPDRLVLRNLSLRLDDEGRDFVRVSRVRVRWSLWAWIRGERRPARVTLEGLEAGVSLVEGRPEAWVQAARRLRGSAGPASSVPSRDFEDLGVEVRDGAVEVRDGGSGEVAFRLARIEAEATLDGKEWRLEGRGVLEGSGDASSSWTLEARRDADGALLADLRAEDGLVLPRVPGWGLPAGVSVGRVLAERPAGGETLTWTVEDLRLDRFRWQKVLPDRIEAVEHLRIGEARGVIAPGRAGSGDRFAPVRALVIQGLSAEVRVGGAFPGVFRLSGGRLDLDRDEEGAITLAIQGGVTSPDGRESGGHVTLRLGPDGLPREVRGRLAGPVIPWLLSQADRHVLPWPGGTADLRWSAEGDGRRFRFEGDVSGTGLSYFWTKICLVPLTDLAFSAVLSGELDLDQDRVSLRLDPWNVGPAVYGLEVWLERFRHPQPKVGVRFTVPRQPCQAVASSIPPAMIPRLEGMRFTGSMDLDLEVTVDLAGLSFVSGGPVGRTVVKGATLRFDGDLEGCEARTLGRQVRLESLDGPLVFRIPPGEKPREEPPIDVGPGTPSYVPLERIPEPVWQAALATEDMGFFKHQGFKLGLIRRAIVLNLDRGWYVYGGSTITQQLVKNLFLSREKTLARKLEEAIIVWQLERRLTKERILELYLNVIEFGRRIYGIRAASQAYFHKEPEVLTPLGGAFLMATKPAPVYAWKVYQKRQFSRWWVDRLRGILQRLWQEMQVLDEKTYLEAAPYLPLFWYPEEGIYAYPAVDPSLLVPPGMPTELPGKAPEIRDDPPAGGEPLPSPRSP